MSSYLAFLASNARFLAFGLLLACFSSFGQTFYIGLFGGPLREAFGLGHGAFGQVYMIATLASAAAFAFAGRLIDRIRLRIFAGFSVAGLACAAAALAGAGGVASLAAALFGLRFFGQGLVTHTAHTATARHFDAGRGKALSIVMLGHPLGEALLPLAAAVALGALGWRGAWWAAAGLLVLVVLPATLALPPAAATSGRAAGMGPAGAWVRLFGDRRFLFALPAVLAPAFVSTGFAFHIAALAAERSWAVGTVALGYSVYAAMKVGASLLVGLLVDRLGARRLMPGLLVALVLACLLLLVDGAFWIIFPFLGLLGASGGITQTILGAVWAELYGVAELGAIKSVYFVLMVFSSALAPAVFGWAIDAGAGFSAIALSCVAVMIGAKGLLIAGDIGRR